MIRVMIDVPGCRLVMAAALILLSLVLSFVSAQQNEEMVYIYKTTDNEPVISDCYPHYNSSYNSRCNLRSAISACDAVGSNATCIIFLPVMSNITVDVSFGQLNLEQTLSIDIRGQGSTIFRVGNTTGGIESEVVDDVWPFATSALSGTNYARVNFDEACLNACPGDNIRFSVCENGDTDIDTSFRLFLGSTEVAENEDTCNFGAEISYTISTNQPTCDDYCLHMGCWGDSSCQDNVTAYRTLFASPRFFLYEGNVSMDAIPSLSISNTTITGFGDAGEEGGAIRSFGNVHLALDSVYFVNNIGSNGGSVFVSNNTLGSVEIHDCVFENSTASSSVNSTSTGGAMDSSLADYGSGGGVYIGADVVGVVITGATWAHCDARLGGGLYLGTNIKEVFVAAADFSNCTSTQAGGSVYIGAHCENVTMANISISDTVCLGSFDPAVVEHSGDGGAIYVGNQNQMILLSDVDIQRTHAQQAGAAVYIADMNTMITIQSIVVVEAASTHGSAIYLGNDNTLVTISDAYFENIVAYMYGGSFYANQRNSHIVLDDVTIRNSNASLLGGAFYLEPYNSHVTFSNIDVTHARSGYGGGAVFITQFNEQFTISDAIFNDTSIDSGDGGCIYINASNSQVLLLDLVVVYSSSIGSGTGIDATTSGYGGVLFVNSDNTNVTLHTVSMYSCNAAYGGAIAVMDGNVNLQLFDVAINDTIATQHGGAIYVHQNNQNITLSNCEISNATAVAGNGGGLYIYTKNQQLTIVDTVMRDLLAADGGAVYLYSAHQAFTLQDSQISQSHASRLAGALYLGDNSTQMSIASVVFSNCTAFQRGGAIWATKNADWTVTLSTFQFCQARSGGAIFLDTNSTGVVVSGSEFVHCSATQDGGAVYLNKENRHLQLVQSTFTSCSVGRYGGAVFSRFLNDWMAVTLSTFSYCSAAQGGAVHLVQSNNVGFYNSVMQFGEASEDGGGLIISGSTVGVLLRECELRNNTAGAQGGGVYSSRLGESLVLAGSLFYGNAAQGSGGGVYLESGNLNFLITTAEAFAAALIAESEHPYQYNEGQIVFNFTAEYATAAEFLLHFDRATKIASQDKVVVFTLSDAGDRTVVFEAFGSEALPGIKLPSLRVAGSALHIELIGSSSQYSPATSYADNLYGIKAYLVPVEALSSTSSSSTSNGTPTRFLHNSAALRGGGLYMFTAIEFAKLLGTQFVGNVAGTGGGGIYLRNAMTGLILQSVYFERNESPLQGGALVVASASYGVELVDCVFVDNLSGSLGGAVVFNTNNGYEGGLEMGNEIVVKGCNFTGNAADLGGAIYMDNQNLVYLLDTIIHNNSAVTSGGGLYVFFQNVVIMENVTVASNQAYLCGAGLILNSANEMTLSDCTVSDNVVTENGAGMCVLDQSSVQFRGSNITVSGNAAGRIAGGILLQNAALWGMLLDDGGLLTLSGNTASRGSAVYIANILATSNRTVHDVHFLNNVATAGGTAFWLYEPGVMTDEPPGLTDPSSRNVFAGNEALYGRGAATQAIGIIGPHEYNVSVYYSALSPSITYQLVDFYNTILPENGSTTIFVSIFDPSAATCSGRFPFLSGRDIEGDGAKFVDGIVEFANLEVFCYPGDSLTLQLEARLLDMREVEEVFFIPITNFYIYDFVQLHFRTCDIGEEIVFGECTVCPTGFYSLEYPVTADTACIDCTKTEGVDTCYADQIVLEDGYWRRFETTHEVLKCPQGEDSCASTNLTGQAVCTEGYEIPLCSVCADEYYRASDETCQTCENAGTIISPELYAFMLITVLLIAYFIASCFRKGSSRSPERKYPSGVVSPRFTALPQERQQPPPKLSGSPQSPKVLEANRRFQAAYSPTGADDETAGPMGANNPVSRRRSAAPPPSPFKRLKTYINKHVKGIIIKSKICINTYQVVSYVPFTVDTEFLEPAKSFLNLLNVVNLNIGSAVPFGCSYGYDYFNKLGVVTLFPIVLTAVIFAVCAVEWHLVNAALLLAEDQRRGSKLRLLVGKYLNLFFIVTYLVLPSVTTTILQTFLCTNVDPDSEDDAPHDWYLTRDMSISCGSSYYAAGVSYASIMILVYPIGVPLVYFLFLYFNRTEIAERDKDDPEKLALAAQSQVSLRSLKQTSSELESQKSFSGLQSFRTNSAGFNLVEEGVTIDSPTPTYKYNGQRHKLHTQLSDYAGRISFLWDAYEPQYWYWEVVETVRRLLLTAVLSITATGTTPQVILGVLLSLFVLKLYEFFNPYEVYEDGVVANMGMYQIFFTFFSALVFQKTLLRSDLLVYVAVFVVLINLGVIVLFVYYELQKLIIELVEGVMAWLHTVRLALARRSLLSKAEAEAADEQEEDGDVELASLADSTTSSQRRYQEHLKQVNFDVAADELLGEEDFENAFAIGPAAEAGQETPPQGAGKTAAAGGVTMAGSAEEKEEEKEEGGPKQKQNKRRRQAHPHTHQPKIREEESPGESKEGRNIQ